MTLEKLPSTSRKRCEYAVPLPGYTGMDRCTKRAVYVSRGRCNCGACDMTSYYCVAHTPPARLRALLKAVEQSEDAQEAALDAEYAEHAAARRRSRS